MGSSISFRQSWKLMTQSIDRQYFYDTNWNLTGTMETTNNNTYGNAKVSYPTENVATNSENTVYKSKTFFTEDVVGTSKTTTAVLSSMISKNMVGIPIRTEKWTGTTLANSAEIEYAAFNSTQLLPKNLHLRDNNSTNWVVKYTISDYNPDGLPAQIKMGGFT